MQKAAINVKEVISKIDSALDGLSENFAPEKLSSKAKLEIQAEIEEIKELAKLAKSKFR